MVPTRELADQVLRNVEQLSAFCAKDVQAVKLTDQVSDAVQRSILSSAPDIVISTPARAWQNISTGALPVESLTHLILDEADLVLSYGYDEDLQNIARTIPKGLQTILMSATLTTDVDTVKGLFCRDPTVLDLEEPDAEGEGVSQFFVKCGEDEKFLLAYVIFKLQLVKGKCEFEKKNMHPDFIHPCANTRHLQALSSLQMSTVVTAFACTSSNLVSVAQS